MGRRLSTGGSGAIRERLCRCLAYHRGVPGQRKFPIVVVKPHPALWREALREAEGDARRIEVVTPTRLIVHPPSPRQAPAGDRPRASSSPAG